jgi:hypothetical protein
MVFVDVIAIPLEGVKVVVSVTSSVCRVRRLRAALLRLQVTRVVPARLIVRSSVQTVIVVPRVRRPPSAMVPTWRTVPGPGVANVVMIVVAERASVVVVRSAIGD